MATMTATFNLATTPADFCLLIYRSLHTTLHPPWSAVADNKYLCFTVSASTSWLVCSRARTTSFHEAFTLLSSQYCSMSILHRSISPRCNDSIFCSCFTGTPRNIPNKNQLSTSFSSSNKHWSVGIDLSTINIVYTEIKENQWVDNLLKSNVYQSLTVSHGSRGGRRETR